MRLSIIALLTLFNITNANAQATEGRRYWYVSIDSVAAGRVAHTHISVMGRITLRRLEADGDLHIRLAGAHSFIVAECIPSLCGNCKTLDIQGMFAVGKKVKVLGIQRYDAEHKWYEVHPVESVVEVAP